MFVQQTTRFRYFQYSIQEDSLPNTRVVAQSHPSWTVRARYRELHAHNALANGKQPRRHCNHSAPQNFVVDLNIAENLHEHFHRAKCRTAAGGDSVR